MTVTLLKSTGHISGLPHVCLGLHTWQEYLRSDTVSLSVQHKAHDGGLCILVMITLISREDRLLGAPTIPTSWCWYTVWPPLERAQNQWLASNHQNTAKVTGCFTGTWLYYPRCSFCPARASSPLLAMTKQVAMLGNPHGKELQTASRSWGHLPANGQQDNQAVSPTTTRT